MPVTWAGSSENSQGKEPRGNTVHSSVPPLATSGSTVRSSTETANHGDCPWCALDENTGPGRSGARGQDTQQRPAQGHPTNCKCSQGGTAKATDTQAPHITRKHAEAPAVSVGHTRASCPESPGPRRPPSAAAPQGRWSAGRGGPSDRSLCSEAPGWSGGWTPGGWQRHETAVRLVSGDLGIWGSSSSAAVLPFGREP